MNPTGLVWIASYLKSGNTWLRCLIDSLLHGGAAPALSELPRRYPWSAGRLWLEAVTEVPTSDLTPSELTALFGAAHQALAEQSPIARMAAPGVRFIKVHDRYQADSFSGGDGAVYIVRDPRGVVPSLADHAGISLDQAITLIGDADYTLAGSISQPGRGMAEHIGSWSDHVCAWLDGFPGPLLLLRYEDLLAYPMRETARLAHFLGLPEDAGVVQAAVEVNRFELLRAEEERADFIERGERQQRFFRRGKAEGWQDELTPAQHATLLARHGAVMQRLGYLEAS